MSDLPQHMPKREVYSEGLGCCGYILLFFSILLYLPVLPLAIASSLKMVNSYERAVIFRLGQMVAGGEASGLFCIVPCIDTYTKVDMRTLSYDVPPQEILTKDFVTVAVDAVVYYRIFDAYASITAVHDVNRSTRLLAQTALRNVLGTMALAQILSHREEISNQMQMSLDHATDPWGVKVERVEVKDVRLPVSLQRAMAAEAEATREAKAKIVAAKGEQTASKALLEAAQIIAGSPEALQLRYLQTLTGISGKNNSTIVFPVPRNLLKSFGKPTTQMAVA